MAETTHTELLTVVTYLGRLGEEGQINLGRAYFVHFKVVALRFFNFVFLGIFI